MKWGFYNPMTDAVHQPYITQEEAAAACLETMATEGIVTDENDNAVWSDAVLNGEFFVFAVTDVGTVAENDEGLYEPVLNNVKSPDIAIPDKYPNNETTRSIMEFAGNMLHRSTQFDFDPLPAWQDSNKVPFGTLIEHFIEHLLNVHTDPAPCAELAIRLMRIAERDEYAYPTIFADYLYQDKRFERYSEAESRKVLAFADLMIQRFRKWDTAKRFARSIDEADYETMWDALLCELEKEPPKALTFRWVDAAVMLMLLRDKEIRMQTPEVKDKE